MHIRTKFLRLRKPVSLDDRIDDWRVCWLGGWDKGRVFFVVMVCPSFIGLPETVAAARHQVATK